MARIEARDVQMHVESLAISDVVQEAQEHCAFVAASHPVSIDIPVLPAISGDRELLGKVVCNLLENAAKYSSPLSPISVRGEIKDEFLAISVADHGIGIDPSEQGLIFDRLYRSRTQTEGTSGTGMGLAICRAIIEAHHGALSVKSQLGKGSVFTFTLPLADRE